MSHKVSIVARTLLIIVGVSLSTAHAQEPAKRLYVVRAVGDWVLFDGGKPLQLRPLDPVLPTALIGIRPGAIVDTGHALVLRDPRSLRTATWKCNPVGRCRIAQRVSRLTFTGASLPTSKRTGALFVHLGESRDERSRVKLVGARGAEQDMGLVLLFAHSDTIDRELLISRAGNESSQSVARICPLQPSAEGTRGACELARDIGKYDCDLNSKAQCDLSGIFRKESAVSIQIFSRVGSVIARDPSALGFGVVALSQRNKSCLMRLREAYARDLGALETSVSMEEFRALEAAAAAEIARGCS